MLEPSVILPQCNSVNVKMKKQRISKVLPEHKQILDNLETKRISLELKIKNVNQRRAQPKHGHIVKKTVPILVPIQPNQKVNNTNAIKQPVKFVRIEKLPWLDDRLTENVRQWGVRTKIDVDKVKALAAQLRRPKKKPTTNIRMNPEEPARATSQ